MAQRIITIRNLKTEKDYQVDEIGWDKIKAKGWESKYTIVREEEVRKPIGRSFMPNEVAQAAEKVKASTGKEQTSGTRKGTAQDQ